MSTSTQRTTDAWPVVDAYQITVTRAYRMDELGTGYSLSPWGSDTADYQADERPVRIRLHPDIAIAESVLGEQLLYLAGEQWGMTLQEAVWRHLAVED